MKKSALLIVVAMMLAAHVAKSQNLIAVQNGGAPIFYLQVDDAILNSQDGDTIYIPGGTWNLTQPINKRLHIIGVGHHPDSTNATFCTTLNGNITLVSGASNGTLTGININGGIAGTNDIVTSYTMCRCRTTGGISLFQTNSNFIFIEYTIEGAFNSIGVNGNPTNCSFFNNVFEVGARFQIGNPIFIFSSFENNIFLSDNYNAYWGSFFCIMSAYSSFANNIFYGIIYTGTLLEHVGNSIFKNNLFVMGIGFPNGTNVGSNNLEEQAQSSIFVNPSGSDYHLQSTCPGKNAGTDGTDIGIYGGIYPWKEGSIPSNPHFQSVNVAPAADSAGNLNINIKVAAQDR